MSKSYIFNCAVAALKNIQLFIIVFHLLILSVGQEISLFYLWMPLWTPPMNAWQKGIQ